MSANYDVSYFIGCVNVYHGTTDSILIPGANNNEISSMPTVSYLNGGNFLSSTTIGEFRSAGALSENGSTPTGILPLYIMEDNRGNDIYIGLYASLNSSGYIDNLTLCASKDTTYANVYTRSGGGLTTPMIEGGENIYFYMSLQYAGGALRPSFCLGRTYSRSPVSYGEWVSRWTGNPTQIGAYYSSLRITAWASGASVGEDSFEKIAQTSEEGGGDGDYDTTNTTTEFPTLPTLSVIGTGLVNVWNPSAYDISLLNQWLWRDTSIFENAKNIIDSPLQLITSLRILPLSPVVGAEEHFCLAGQDSAINMHPVTQQYMAIDCGSIAINEYFGSALDYGAYTKIKIFIPFIGFKELSPDDCMGGSIALRYNVDVVTGDCVACIKCIRTGGGLSNVLYTYGGNMAYDVPLTSLNFSAKNKADVSNAMGVVSGIMSQNPTNVISSAMGIMTNKPTLERASDMKGNTGFLGNKQPFIVIERPIQSLPANAGQYYGYPSNITSRLGDLNGYTEIDHIIETNIHCTLDEWEEINELLKDGVYL